MSTSEPVASTGPVRPSLSGMFLLTAAGMALGWRIRGQFGHEIGAAIAGMLGALAIVLTAGREDWRRRAEVFALLGALGWSFGGSMSYMKVVGYCHSSDAATVLYGFVCLSVIGFLWAAPGAAAIAMAGTFDAGRIERTIQAIAAVFAAWFAQDIVMDVLDSRGIETDWYGSDWLGVTVALLAAALLAAARREVDAGVSLVAHLAVGWWIAFGGLVVAAGLHMNPPRGDNWAGCLGIVGGLIVYCRRYRLDSVLRAALVTGFLGGMGFAAGQLFKLSLIAAGGTDMHPWMEWTHGALFGLALVAGLRPLMRDAPELVASVIAPPARTMALFTVLWVVPYYNFVKCAEQWQKQFPVLKEAWQGLPLAARLLPSHGWIGWIDLVFAIYGVALIMLIVRQRRVRAALIPESPQGQAQLLFVVLAWVFAIASFARDVTNFGAGSELRIQALITIHTIACTWLALWPATPVRRPAVEAAGQRTGWIRIIAAGVLGLLIASAVCYAGKQALFKDTYAAGFYMDHIRFGPKNTNDTK